MNLHKNTRLLPYEREAIWRSYTQDKISVTSLARQYGVSRPTIYNVLKADRGRLLTQKRSTNNRFKQTRYGIKRLAKVEHAIQEKLENKPNATINPTPEKWYTSIPNGCRCSKDK